MNMVLIASMASWENIISLSTMPTKLQIQPSPSAKLKKLYTIQFDFDFRFILRENLFFSSSMSQNHA